MQGPIRMGRRGGTLEMWVIPAPSDSGLQTNIYAIGSPSPTEPFLAGAQQHRHAPGLGQAQPTVYIPDSPRLCASCLQWCRLWEKA